MTRMMKDSGVEWIGEIPENWDMRRVKSSYKNHKDVVGRESFNYERLALTLNGVIKRNKEDTVGLQPENFDTYQILKTNELVFKLIDLQNVSTSRVGYSPFTGIVSPAYIILTPKNKVSSKFGEYYFKSMWQREIFNHIGDDGVRSSLNASDLLNIPYPTLEYSEQEKIAEFLDDKCGAIDEIISKTEQSIEEYKKLKQSVITKAVTKGIRPNRPMQDSNIEWIGEIPEDWNVRKTLHCLSMPITDGPHTTPQFFEDGIPFISAESVSFGKGKIDLSHARGYISDEFYKECCLKYVPKINDLLMIKSGATTGRVSIVDIEKKFTIWSPLAVFRVNPSMLFYKFLFYFIQSQNYQKQLEDNWSFGTQQNIGMRVLEQLKIVLPPLDEQKEIADYLDEKCSEIDTLVEKKQQFLAEMANYKKSLIYEYVTGKKEVA